MKNNSFQIWNCQPNQLPLFHHLNETEIMESVTANNFHLKTKANFKFLKYGGMAFDMFESLVKENGLFFRSLSGSRYVVSGDLVYRISNHWGKVASCKWSLVGAPGMPVGSISLAVCKLSDFEDMKKPMEYVLFEGKNIKTGRFSQYGIQLKEMYEGFMNAFEGVQNYRIETIYE